MHRPNSERSAALEERLHRHLHSVSARCACELVGDITGPLSTSRGFVPWFISPLAKAMCISLAAMIRHVALAQSSAEQRHDAAVQALSPVQVFAKHNHGDSQRFARTIVIPDTIHPKQ